MKIIYYCYVKICKNKENDKKDNIELFGNKDRYSVNQQYNIKL